MLSQRLPPEMDADALVRDAIDTTIAGLRAGVAIHSNANGGGSRKQDPPYAADTSNPPYIVEESC
jgi:hypothetical protein